MDEVERVGALTSYLDSRMVSAFYQFLGFRDITPLCHQVLICKIEIIAIVIYVSSWDTADAFTLSPFFTQSTNIYWPPALDRY